MHQADPRGPRFPAQKADLLPTIFTARCGGKRSLGLGQGRLPRSWPVDQAHVEVELAVRSRRTRGMGTTWGSLSPAAACCLPPGSVPGKMAVVGDLWGQHLEGRPTRSWRGVRVPGTPGPSRPRAQPGFQQLVVPETASRPTACSLGKLSDLCLPSNAKAARTEKNWQDRSLGARRGRNSVA